MEQIELSIEGKLYEIEETEGSFSVVQNAVFLGQLFKEKDKWLWESADGNLSANFPWEAVAQKLDKHLANLSA